ncbi:MAG: ATP-NAD kinase family protein [Sulfolobus sp.]
MVVCFIVNPVAGSGGRIGHKGSDDLSTYNPETPLRIDRFLQKAPKVEYLVGPGVMGEKYFYNKSFSYSVVNIKIHNPTVKEDTINVVKEFMRSECEIIVFAGGDGTARDIYGLTKDSIPLLGIPTGVKMHSGIFATTPELAGLLLDKFIKKEANMIYAEILDVDEEAYRKGQYAVKLYGFARTISYSNYLTPSKSEIPNDPIELEDIAEYILNEVLKPNEIYIIGPGSTTKYILKKLGYEPNFLCTDVMVGKSLIKSCVNYYDLMNLTGELNIILTPIGKQGFLIGRGNQEIGPEILKRIGKDRIIVISTKEKIETIDCLRIDTGDPQVDKILYGVYKVIVGYKEYIAIKSCNITD